MCTLPIYEKKKKKSTKQKTFESLTQRFGRLYTSSGKHVHFIAVRLLPHVLLFDVFNPVRGLFRADVVGRRKVFGAFERHRWWNDVAIDRHEYAQSPLRPGSRHRRDRRRRMSEGSRRRPDVHDEHMVFDDHVRVRVHCFQPYPGILFSQHGQDQQVSKFARRKGMRLYYRLRCSERISVVPTSEIELLIFLL